jgi:hypothetical protein
MYGGKIIAECISDDDSVDDVAHALLRLLCSEEREDIMGLDEKAPHCRPNYRDHDADAHDLGAKIIAQLKLRGLTDQRDLGSALNWFDDGILVEHNS